MTQPPAIPLFPIAPDPIAVAPTPPAPPPGSQVGLDWQFDYDKGDFVVDANGEVPKIEGALVPAQQAVAQLLVDRAWHSMFTRRHGIAYHLAMNKRLRPQTHVSLETQTRDRLRRIAGVKDVEHFVFEDEPDTVRCSFVVVLDVGVRYRLAINPDRVRTL